MIHLVSTLQVLGISMVDRVRRRANGDKGQTAAEYMGIIVVVALIIAAIVGSGIDTDIADGITSKIGDIFGGGA